MRLLRTFTLLALLAASTTVFAETAKVKAEEISAAEADKFLAFYNKFVDAIVQNKDNCPKMAGAISGVISTNQDQIRKAHEAKTSGKKLPKAYEEKMMARVKEMMPAMQKCGADKDVQAAISKLDQKELEKAPAKK